MTELIRPPALTKGDVIAIAASSSPFKRRAFEKGLSVIRSLGVNPRFDEGIFTEGLYLAGTDARRAEELNSYLNDPDVKAILFARGGYGIQRILPLLDFSAFKANPKIVLGFSDITALTNFITGHLGIACFYGPVVTALAANDESTNASLQKALTGKSALGEVASGDLLVIKEGEAHGRLMGGCLSMITSSIGTKYDLPTEGSILFIEDHDEKIYAYDRLLTHLKNAGRLRGVAGIVFGSLGLSRAEKHPEHIWQVLEELLHDFPGPVVAKFPAGHTSPFITLPLGVRCRLSTKPPVLSFEEAAVI